MTDPKHESAAHGDISRKRWFRRPALTCATLFLVVGACAAGGHWWTTGRHLQSTDNAYVRADIVTISPRVSGYIVKEEVGDNQRVAAGDALARIDDRDYRARVERAQGAVETAAADIESQKAAIASIDAQALEQRSLIAEVAADVQARQADGYRAELEDRRQRLLNSQQATSRQKLEAADAESARTQAAVVSRQAAFTASRRHLAVLATERRRAHAALDKARAALKQAEADLELAKIDLTNTVITAPTAGTVGQRSVRVGQYAEIGMPLMVVVPNDSYIIANYKETQVARVLPGQAVRIEVDAFGGLKLSGRVSSFAPASGAQFALLPPDNATGNFTKIVQRMPILIRVDGNQDRAADLRPGMSVVTTIDTRDRSSP